MSTTDVIGNHPGNQYPLKAWLLREQKMIEGGLEYVMYIDHAHNELAVTQYKVKMHNSGSEQQAVQHRNYKIGIDAIPLHPTGVMGKNECPECFGMVGIVRYVGNSMDNPCPTCNGSGYVPDQMIYEGDVIEIDTARDTTHRFAVVFWYKAGWYVRKSDGWWIPLWRLVEQKRRITILCSIFDLRPKPDNVSNEQWKFIVEQHEDVICSHQSS